MLKRTFVWKISNNYFVTLGPCQLAKLVKQYYICISKPRAVFIINHPLQLPVILHSQTYFRKGKMKVVSPSFRIIVAYQTHRVDLIILLFHSPDSMINYAPVSATCNLNQ